MEHRADPTSDDQMSILLVDDRRENLVALASVLDSLGAHLVMARSGREALLRLLERDFGVILLDVFMPDIDGFETARLIRARPRSQHTPIIFLTAINKTDEHVARGYEIGAVDYVFKPFDPHVLRAKVAALMELYRKTRALEREIALRRDAEERLRLLTTELEARVVERTRALQAVNSELESEIVRRQQVQEELLRAKEAAEQANRVKSLFLANMSHELRTPLNAIIGYAELIMEDVAERGLTEFAPDLHRINGAGKHLLGLINDILDLAKIEAGKVEVHREEVNIAELLREVAAIMTSLIEHGHNRLELRCPPDIGALRTDPLKLRQALLNLLSNAAKFTKDGLITLSVAREPGAPAEDSEASAPAGWMVFRVHDTGIGLDQAQQERIFTAFTQADPSTTRQYGGTGLGLAITRYYCRMLGGDVSVDSELGAGATFTIRLPLQAPPGSGAAAGDEGGDAPKG